MASMPTQFTASQVDSIMLSVVSDMQLDTSDPFIAKALARVRAALDRAEIRIVVRSAPAGGA